jgi:hypothetical protein
MCSPTVSVYITLDKSCDETARFGASNVNIRRFLNMTVNDTA